MLLQNKTAVIYGAGGSLGGAVAKALAAAGATVFLTGHRPESIKKTADDIIAAGGKAHTDVVDGFDGHAIAAHLQKVVQTAGKVDISFNAVEVPVVQNTPLLDISPDDFVRPITHTMQTRFLTATAAGRVMMQQGFGVILFLTATPAGIGYPYTGGFGPACSAVETLSRALASELGLYGVRVVTIRSGGSPDSRVFMEAQQNNPVAMEGILQGMKNDTMLKTLPLMEDIANTAVFISSGMAAKITGVTVDVTCGTTAGLNYRASRQPGPVLPK